MTQEAQICSYRSRLLGPPVETGGRGTVMAEYERLPRDRYFATGAPGDPKGRASRSIGHNVPVRNYRNYGTSKGASAALGELNTRTNESSSLRL